MALLLTCLLVTKTIKNDLKSQNFRCYTQLMSENDMKDIFLTKACEDLNYFLIKNCLSFSMIKDEPASIKYDMAVSQQYRMVVISESIKFTPDDYLDVLNIAIDKLKNEIIDICSGKEIVIRCNFNGVGQQCMEEGIYKACISARLFIK